MSMRAMGKGYYAAHTVRTVGALSDRRIHSNHVLSGSSVPHDIVRYSVKEHKDDLVLSSVVWRACQAVDEADRLARH